MSCIWLAIIDIKEKQTKSAKYYYGNTLKKIV